MTPKLPLLNSRQVIAILKRRGFVFDRQSGSHAVFIHSDGIPTDAEQPFLSMANEIG